MARRGRAAVKSLDGVGFDFDTDGKSGHVTANVPNITPAATGGLFRSGDIFSANENGVPEMIGRFGNQTGVANQDQIVNGIASGVSQANGNVESRLVNIETLLNRLLQKEFVAKAVPSSSWGNNNAKSQEAWERVNG